MGRGFTQYTYLDGDLPDELTLRSAYLHYILDDGVRLHINQADYYCPTCGHFIVGERIETVSDLEHQIDQSENNPHSNHRKIAEYFGNIPKQLAELQTRIKWRKNRQAPPKCLHCGSTEILPIPNTDEFSHPATGQRMIVSAGGFASTDEWHATYTPEGDKIESSGR